MYILGVLFIISSAFTIIATCDTSNHEKKVGRETDDKGSGTKIGAPKHVERNLTFEIPSTNDFLYSGYYKNFYSEDEKQNYGKKILFTTVVAYGLKAILLDILDGLQFFGFTFPTRLAIKLRYFNMYISYFKIYVTDIYDSLRLSYHVTKKSNDIKRDIENTKKQLARQYRRKTTKYITFGLTSFIGMKLIFSHVSRSKISQSIEYPEPITKIYIGERIKQKYKFLTDTTTTDPNEKVIEKDVKKNIRNHIKDAYYFYYHNTKRMKNALDNFFRKLFNRKNP
mmetsp:Transcript_33654/g.32127  ORF Transcript_33654/g.32127 Transcript_33654/m.32127 type:complete len:282 (-) Transcript_33654:1788-2633(-)